MQFIAPLKSIFSWSVTSVYENQKFTVANDQGSTEDKLDFNKETWRYQTVNASLSAVKYTKPTLVSEEQTVLKAMLNFFWKQTFFVPSCTGLPSIYSAKCL